MRHKQCTRPLLIYLILIITVILIKASSIKYLEEISGPSFGHKRDLSWWVSLMNFLQCPRSPLGHTCHNDKKTNKYDTVENYYDHYEGAYSTITPTSGSINSIESDDGTGEDTSDKDSSNKSSYAKNNTNNYGFVDINIKSSELICGVIAFTTAGVITVVMIRKKTSMDLCHPLRGSVNRRKDLFENIFLCQEHQDKKMNDRLLGDFSLMA